MIWLIGFRAAGKTTLGRALALELGRRFLDCDEEFEMRHGSILAFADRHGVAAFRREEEALLRTLSGGAPGHVLATGGGFVDHAPSREFLASAPGPKVWLDPPAEVLWERLEGDQKRLKIGDLSTYEGMRALWEKRRPFYEKIATSRLASQDISECLALMKNLVGEP